MNIIGWLMVGALAGWWASTIVVTNGQQGWLMNIVIGVVGAFIGGVIYSLLFNVDFAAALDLVTLVVATLGAVILLIASRAVVGRTTQV